MPNYVLYIFILSTSSNDYLTLIFLNNLSILNIGGDIMNYLPINQEILNTHKADC